ncbi:hypothetical protein SUDANB146_05747 [Streptomyces sp. enrichment culture]
MTRSTYTYRLHTYARPELDARETAQEAGRPVNVHVGLAPLEALEYDVPPRQLAEPRVLQLPDRTAALSRRITGVRTAAVPSPLGDTPRPAPGGAPVVARPAYRPGSTRAVRRFRRGPRRVRRVQGPLGQPDWSLSFIAPQPCHRSTSTQALTRRRSRSGYSEPP